MKKLAPLAALVAAFLFVIGLALPAQAHNASDFYTSIWDTPTPDYYFSQNTNWTNVQQSAFENADHQWDAVATTQDLTFVAHESPLKDWTGCGASDSINIVEKVGQQSWNGLTTVCINGGIIQKFWLRLNTAGNVYWGSLIPEPTATDVGMQGILTHEFGHATGWKKEFQDVDSSVCDQSLAAGSWQTMCQGGWFNSNGVIEENRDLSLEDHDIHTFQHQYS